MNNRLIKLLLMSVLLGALSSVWADDTIVRITETEAKKLLATRVEPEYPTIAKQMHLSGNVIVDAFIEPDGRVEKVQVLNGNPLLSSATVSAIKRWKFNPYTANGKPMRAVASFNVGFTLH